MENNIVNELKSWIGTPYRNFSRGRGVGTDCAYYIVESLHTCGLLVGFEYNHTSPVSYLNSEYIIEKIFKLGLREVNRVQPGTILAFRLREVVEHLGVYVGDGQMVTCSKQHGVFECPVWLDKLAKAFEVNV